jgi:hypothetical protein
MLIPESPGPNNNQLGGQVVSWPTLDELALDEVVPKTTIDHLLSEEERRKAEQERKEFEVVGRMMDLSEVELYPIVYESACEKIASGMSHDDIRVEMMMLADTPDLPFGSIIRQAYEDVLAGRPPRIGQWGKGSGPFGQLSDQDTGGDTGT